MFRRLKATKDTYITNKIIDNSFRATDANTGQAATLDLFKLYNENSISGESKPIELTRLLVKFDLDPLRNLTGSILDISDSSFKCTLKLTDVYGGQTVPSNFKVIVFPLSQSFDEGVGRDVIKFQDIDTTNFITASISGDSAVKWFHSGANKQGLLGSEDIDIISSGNLRDGNGVSNIWKEQTFGVGTENLSIDITTIVSATIAGQLPDHGLRISFSGTQETDTKTRFVKRFASRNSQKESNRPVIEIAYDDTLQDNSKDFFFNLSGSVFLNNFERGEPADLVSGSALTRITGSNSLLLKLVTGSFSKYYTASQASHGNNFVTGVYSSSFAFNTFGSSSLGAHVKNTVEDFIRDSGSVKFVSYWQSVDMSVSYLTSSLTIKRLDPTAFDNDPIRFIVNISNLQDVYPVNQKVRLRFVAFNAEEKVNATKVPLYRTSEILPKCYYRIKDHFSEDIIVPFGDADNSTLMSTDSEGMYFDIYTEDFPIGRVYSFDVLIKNRGTSQVFENVGGTFRVESQ